MQLASLRAAGAPVPDVLHTALVELHGRNFRAHSERHSVLSAVCGNLLSAVNVQDAELVVLFDFCSDQFEISILQRVSSGCICAPLIAPTSDATYYAAAYGGPHNGASLGKTA